MSEDTIFHKIIRREIPAAVEYEDEQVLAFRDAHPRAPTHILIVPKQKSIAKISEMTAGDEGLIGHMFFVATKLAREKGVEGQGYRLVLNCGEAAGQSVDLIHLHLLGGRDLSWPPG